MPRPSRLSYAFHLLAKPTGAVCNLDCQYCFFLSKEELYPGSGFRMSDEVLDAYIRQLLEAQQGPEVVIAWQGGEPTLMGLEFFERSIACVEKYRKPNQQVTHTIQTNGTRLDNAWGAFFEKHRFLVGLSVDGPKAMHDAYRVNKGGSGTFDQVRRGWEFLRTHGVDVNILCTVHAANGDHPVEVYRFFRDELGAGFMQFIPIVERATTQSLPIAGLRKRPGARAQRGSLFLRPLRQAGLPAGQHPREAARGHGRVGPAAEFGQDKFDTLPRNCRTCEVLFACYGECPRNRFIETPDGEPGLNYLCAGYKRFFTHVNEPMKVMANLLREDRYADEVMGWYAEREQARFAGVGRNDPCPCGSGRKFKKCHGETRETARPDPTTATPNHPVEHE